jgi:hypothetical protein
MITRILAPDGDLCSVIHLISPSFVCTELDETNAMRPFCKLYAEHLNWTISGKILKCPKCLSWKKDLAAVKKELEIK